MHKFFKSFLFFVVVTILPLVASQHTSDEILDYWFGPISEREADPTPHFKRWFMGGREVDHEIREHFSEDHHLAAYGHLNDWTQTPRGRLAVLILLDQFSRNMYRGSPEAFMQDALALHLALEGIAIGHDRFLMPIERVFFYLPLEHAEDLLTQDLSVRKFSELVEEVPFDQRDQFEGFLLYAIRHREDIRAHGRFLYRDKALNR